LLDLFVKELTTKTPSLRAGILPNFLVLSTPRRLPAGVPHNRFSREEPLIMQMFRQGVNSVCHLSVID